MDPNQPSPYPVQGGYVVQGGAPVEGGYVVQGQPYPQQGYPQQVYAPPPPQQQVAYTHVVQPSQGYAPPPQNVSYVQTTQTHGEPVQPQQTQVVVVHTHDRRGDDGSKLAAAWILFGVGFIFPILWCVGAMFIKSKHDATRVAGILNLIFGLLAVLTIVIVPIVVVTVGFSVLYN
jgi:thiol:disulfide interchange protein